LEGLAALTLTLQGGSLGAACLASLSAALGGLRGLTTLTLETVRG